MNRDTPRLPQKAVPLCGFEDRWAKLVNDLESVA